MKRQRRLAWSIASGLVIIGSLAATQALPDTAAKPEESFNKECSACHMAYPAAFLPARSWQKLMVGLAAHFGENAALDAATSKTITQYLVSHAADAPGQDQRFMRNLGAFDTPLRITETPYWIMRHGEIPAEVFTHPKVKSRANCQACHQDAAQGGFEDE